MPVGVWIVLAVVVVLLLTAAGIYHSIFHPKVMKIGRGPIRVSCVGDSITFGLGVFLCRRLWSYPAVLSQMLGREYTFYNYGLTNRTLLPLGKNDYFKDPVGRQAWDARAEILLFLLGTNDSKAVLWDPKLYERTYRAVLEHYQQMHCFQKMFIMIPPRVFDECPGEKDCNPDILVEQVTPIIRRVAEEIGMGLIDLYAVTKDHREWFPDKLHPNRAGNRAIAEEIVRYLRR